MYNDLTEEEVEQILQVGLEKTAYEEGLAEYTDALEKVAAVHEVDANELHEFLDGLEKEAAPNVKNVAQNAKNKILNKLQNGENIKENLGGRLEDLIGKAKDNPAKAVGAGVGAAGAATGTGVGIKKLLEKRKEDKEKQSSIDNETFEYLFQKGVEALTEE